MTPCFTTSWYKQNCLWPRLIFLYFFPLSSFSSFVQLLCNKILRNALKMRMVASHRNQSFSTWFLTCISIFSFCHQTSIRQVPLKLCYYHHHRCRRQYYRYRHRHIHRHYLNWRPRGHLSLTLFVLHLHQV